MKQISVITDWRGLTLRLPEGYSIVPPPKAQPSVWLSGLPENYKNHLSALYSSRPVSRRVRQKSIKNDLKKVSSPPKLNYFSAPLAQIQKLMTMFKTNQEEHVSRASSHLVVQVPI